MDDQRFDDSIKSKVGDYEDPQFDPTALAALHHQMAAISVVPWYSLYRTELLVGSGLLISTLIILWSQWFISTNVKETLNEKIVTLQSQQAEIDKLQNQIITLKNAVPDTVRIIEIHEQPSHYYNALLYRIKLLEATNNSLANRETSTGSESQQESSNQTTFNSNDAWSQNRSSDALVCRNLFSSRLSPRTQEKKSVHAEPNTETKLARSISQDLSVKTLRDLEKHYQQGIGIRLGPALEIGSGFYKNGSGKIGITWGALADFILSPSLSLETGVKYAHRIYEISDKRTLSETQLPGMDATLGTLQTIDIDSWVFEIPLNLKYRFPVSIKTQWLTGLGYSSIIYGAQLYEYEYGIESNPSASINSGFRNTHTKVYPGSVNFSLGVSKQLKNKKILETSIYYQQGLGETGLERTKVNYLGVRGVYWFTVR